MQDPISTSVRSLIELFHNELPDLKFPDMDGDLLRRSADEVMNAADAVAAAEAALEQSRSRLADQQEALAQRAQRALAYLRIYAEGQAELEERLDAVNLPRLARRPLRGEAMEPLSLVGSEVNGKRRSRTPRKDPPLPGEVPHDLSIDPPTLAALS